ncbi:hypothetical protein KSP40_PGU016361 [Platanthera guangdongensis]|uniref:Uncharacterized protein n=1 Tax=Platanthera guangdongensis TaxID=2320717 RepID=A0ABR2LRJ5_9ASPA
MMKPQVEHEESPRVSKEEALVRRPAGSRDKGAHADDDMMDDLDEMIFGQKGGSSSHNDRNQRKKQQKDDFGSVWDSSGGWRSSFPAARAGIGSVWDSFPIKSLFKKQLWELFLGSSPPPLRFIKSPFAKNRVCPIRDPSSASFPIPIPRRLRIPDRDSPLLPPSPDRRRRRLPIVDGDAFSRSQLAAELPAR